MNVLISPYSAKLRNGNRNPKEYPQWPQLVSLLGDDVTQIGVTGEQKIVGVESVYLNGTVPELKELVNQSDLWVSVDNFLPHFVNCECNKKSGVVLWGQSDPLIFGYEQNLNLLKDRRYLRQYQFDSWEAATYNAEAFLSPAEVMARICLGWRTVLNEESNVRRVAT